MMSRGTLRARRRLVCRVTLAEKRPAFKFLPAKSDRAVGKINRSSRQAFICRLGKMCWLGGWRFVTGLVKKSALANSAKAVLYSGGRIRTSDLRVMSPTSYQAALPRGVERIIFSPPLLEVNSSRSIPVLFCSYCRRVTLAVFLCRTSGLNVFGFLAIRIASIPATDW